MPQYHSYKYIKVYPASLWRRLFKSWPYYVGDRVKFVFKIDSVPTGEAGMFSIFERFGDDTSVLLNIDKNVTIVEGKIIPREGDVVYKAGFRHLENSLVIFTARAINRDTVFFQWLWFILGAVVTFAGIILAWILGYVQINW